MCPRPPTNLVWVISCQSVLKSVLGSFMAKLKALHLCSTHSGCIVKPGVNRAWNLITQTVWSVWLEATFTFQCTHWWTTLKGRLHSNILCVEGKMCLFGRRMRHFSAKQQAGDITTNNTFCSGETEGFHFEWKPGDNAEIAAPKGQKYTSLQAAVMYLLICINHNLSLETGVKHLWLVFQTTNDGC